MAQSVLECELCSGESTGQLWFCRDCDQTMCDICKLSHLKAKVSKRHEVVSRSAIAEVSSDTTLRFVEEQCDTHTKEVVLLYCSQCKCPICRLCLIGEHLGHTFVKVEEAYANEKKTAENLLTTLKTTTYTEAKHRLSKIDKHLERSNKNVKTVKEEICKAADELSRQVDNAKESLLQILSNHEKVVKHKLEGRKDVVSGEIKTLENKIQTIENSIAAKKPTELFRCMNDISVTESKANVEDLTSDVIQFKPGSYTGSILTTLIGHVNINSQAQKVPVPETQQPGLPSTNNYQFSTLAHAVICQETGRLRYDTPSSGKPEAQLIGPKPFSESFSKFSIEIVDAGKKGYITMGVCPLNYSKNKAPGWGKNSYGYHADDGGFYAQHSFTTLYKETCTVGDVMTCELDVKTRLIQFHKNNNQMFGKLITIPAEGLYPIVNMQSQGEAVLLLEKAPWTSE